MTVSWVFLPASLALAINALSIASVLLRMTRLQKPRVERQAVATLILPLTGRCIGLENLVAALEAQTLRPRRLIITVEAESDPAYDRALQVRSIAGLPIEVVVAGLASDQAQKCRNQQAALRLIDDRDEAIVLMDGDIAPQRWWLSALVSPLVEGNYDLVTGHRWHHVAQHRLGAHLVTAVDRAVTLMPRMAWSITSVVWGGSVAISPAAARKMRLSESLDRTLSDDLSLADDAAAAGLVVLTRGALLIPSPTSLRLGEAWRFAVRQYRIGHIYRPWLWWLAFATVNLRLVGWLAVLHQVLSSGAYLWAAVSLAVLAMIKQALVAEVARRVEMPDPLSVRLVQLGLGLLQPLVDIFHASVIIAAATTRRIQWGHVVYRIAGPHSIKVEERLPFPAS